MTGPSFSQQTLSRNLAAIAAMAPETAAWLRRWGRDPEPHAPCALDPKPLREHTPRTGGITVVIGGGRLDEVCMLLSRVPPGHQVFLLEPRGRLLAAGLGRFDLDVPLTREALVILPPGQSQLEEALGRHPQLGLAEQVDFLNLNGPHPDPETGEAQARLYRLLSHALAARDLALQWEEPRGVNLISNLAQAPLMGRALEAVGCMSGRPALILAAGPSLPRMLERLTGRLGGVVALVCDQALPQVMDAGIAPSAAACTIPGMGRLSCYSHPRLHQTPLIAEETAHAPTLRAHPGPRFVCLGARGTALGPLAVLANHFTPQEHPLGRLAELAVYLGCDPLIIAGADLAQPEGKLLMPSADGGWVRTGLRQAAAACSLGRVLRRHGVQAFNLDAAGLDLPGARAVDWDQATPFLGSEGQPMVIEPLVRERWLGADALDSFAKYLHTNAAAATRLWQRAAAPMADYPPGPQPEAGSWLSAADALYVALAEQAAADPLQAAFLEGCLVRAFLRRHRMVCHGQETRVRVEDACRGLGSCLGDLESRAFELAQGLKETAAEFSELAQALRDKDATRLDEFARRMGRTQPVEAPS